MAPMTRSKKKKEVETLIRRPQSDSSRGIKRSAEEGEKEKTEESNTEKRGRPAEKETHMPLEKVKEENEQKEEEIEKKMDEGEEESSDSSHSETSFMDLPDDALRHIVSFLDLPSSLNLRVNKRLDRLQLSVKYKMEEIELTFESSQFQLIMCDHCSTLASSCFTQLENGLRRLAMNTFVERISIYVDAAMNEQYYRVVEALFHFKSYYLWVNAGRHNISHLILPSFLTIAQNVKEVNIGCTSLSTKDLCTIRKTMLRGGSIKSFTMVDTFWKKGFMRECFGVTISDYLGPLRGKMYRTDDDFLEIYCTMIDGPRYDRLYHFEGDLRTSVDHCEISFEKLDVVVKPYNSFKIRWDHLYRN